MYNANEISDNEIKLFNEKYAPYVLKRIDTDLVEIFEGELGRRTLVATSVATAVLLGYQTNGLGQKFVRYRTSWGSGDGWASE